MKQIAVQRMPNCLKKEDVMGIEIPLSKSVRGRILAQDLLNKKKVKVVLKKGHLVKKDDIKLL